MIKASFPDSSLAFQIEVYNGSFYKWMLYTYNMKSSNSKKFYIKNNDSFIISIDKIIAITKHNVNGFPLAVCIIKDIVSVSLNDNCIKENVIVLSKYCFSEM